MDDEGHTLQAFHDEPSEVEPKDWTTWIWIGIVLLFAGMLIFFWMARSPRPVVTSVRVKHILISFDSSDPVARGRAFERISELREQLITGKDFDSLARSNSDDTVSARRGGDLGWAPRDTYAASFEEYCWGGVVGKISDVIQTQFGFHIILIVDRHIADAELYEAELEQRAFEEMRSQNKDEN
ncbi:MAG: peptidyl-prolyl cis-trans isomerase [Candidatus Hydrogenedentes bacterium]|nr:peptidyl-prolyl cis-trans isomerase [Candidatus Hydrogenedentota bacterium]